MTATLRRRLDRLERRHVGRGRIIVVEQHEHDRHDAIDEVLAEARGRPRGSTVSSSRGVDDAALL
jgi:hypothetical protein